MEKNETDFQLKREISEETAPSINELPTSEIDEDTTKLFQGDYAKMNIPLEGEIIPELYNHSGVPLEYLSKLQPKIENGEIGEKLEKNFFRELGLFSRESGSYAERQSRIVVVHH